MMSQKTSKVIFDTNVLISFLIGKKVQSIFSLIISQKIQIIYSNRLLEEFTRVTQKPKLQQYFNQKKVKSLIEIIKIEGKEFPDIQSNIICRDEKDNFLLDLAEISKADFLITGDNDLLVLTPFHNTQILKPIDFENKF